VKHGTSPVTEVSDGATATAVASATCLQVSVARSRT
jgi:hypothetical protein